MSSSRHGVDSSAKRHAPGLAVAARADAERLYVTFADGRELSMAFPDWLQAASPEARSHLVVEDFGTAIYFEDLDEDVGVEEVLGISEDELYEFAGYQDVDLGPSGSPSGPPASR